MKENEIKLHDGTIITLSEESIKKLREGVKPKRWKPEEGERYWCVTGVGNVHNPYWFDDDYDNHRYQQNNVFKTKEEAKRKREIENILAKYRWNISREDLESTSIKKYGVYINISTKKITIDSWNNWSSSYIFFKTESDAQAVIDEIGYDDWLKYELGVY